MCKYSDTILQQIIYDIILGFRQKMSNSNTFKAKHTLLSTSLDCSVNVFSNVSAAFARFTET